MSSFLQPISVVYFHRLHNGQPVRSSESNGWSRVPDVNVSTVSALLETHPQPPLHLGSWGVGWNIHLVTPGWSKKESNPDNLRGVQMLVGSQPHILKGEHLSTPSCSEVLPLSLIASALRETSRIIKPHSLDYVFLESREHTAALFKASPQLLAPGRFILWKSGWMDKWTNEWILYLV